VFPRAAILSLVPTPRAPWVRTSAKPHSAASVDAGPIPDHGARCVVAFGSICQTPKEPGCPVAKVLPSDQHVEGPPRLEPSQTCTDPVPHALGKTRRQGSRVVAASRRAAKEIGDLAIHCRSDHRQHQVSALCIFAFAQEENPALASKTFAIIELTDRRSDIYARCVHAEHLDPSDRNGSRSCDLAASEEHVGARTKTKSSGGRCDRWWSTGVVDRRSHANEQSFGNPSLQQEMARMWQRRSYGQKN